MQFAFDLNAQIIWPEVLLFTQEYDVGLGNSFAGRNQSDVYDQ